MQSGNTFWVRFTQVAQSRPGAVALSFEGDDTTFGGLHQRSVRLAQGLLAHGLKPGDRIALVAENGPWFVDWLLACACAGLVLIPVNVRLARSEIEYIIQDAEPKLIVCDDERLTLLRAGKTGEAELCGTTTARWSSGAATEPAAPSAAGGTTASPILQIYTSGTTGRPKGAVITNGHIAAGLSNWIPNLGPLGGDDVILACLPLFHIAGISFIVAGLATGAKVVIMRGIVASELVDMIAGHKVTAMLLVPAVIRMMVEVLEVEPQPLPSLRTLVFGASPMPVELIARTSRVVDANLYHVYGLTETTGIVTWLPPQELSSGRRLLSCGRPFNDGVIAIFGPDGSPLAPMEIGEIAYKGPQAISEYWHLPQESRQAVRDGWFFTGDAGYLDADGFLFVRDRFKDMIKSGGENVYPAEVEDVLLKHAGVADCTVVGLEDAKWGEIVVAVVVERSGSTVGLDDLRDFARNDLAGFKLPKKLVKLHELPRSSTGKVLKHLLRDQLVAGVNA